MSGAWEQLRFATVDALVTETKLRGSAIAVNGHTTPEGWPFRVVVAVAAPGNERAVELADEFHRALAHAGAPTARVDNGRYDARTPVTELAEAVRWMAQTVHQAHHQGPLETCPRNTCAHARDVLARWALAH